MIGRTVGSYAILEKLGAGGMGEVYLARHRRLERVAAIKFLLPALSRDADIIARFFNEASALSRVEHDGIVEVIDCDVVDERAYIVMEYLDGESLAAVLARQGSFANEWRAVAALIGQIADALAAAHNKRIIHRDLKPENLFLGLGRRPPFTVKILDFGIAKLASDNLGATSHTRPGSLLGTPSYMAPEQCRGLSALDHRVDIYALGCILFELLAGRRVFEIEAQGDLLMAHIQSPPPRIEDCVAGVPSELADLVATMLAKNPDDRPQSMEEVIKALEKIVGLPIAAFAEAIASGTRLVPKSTHRQTELPALTAPEQLSTPGTAAGASLNNRNVPRTLPAPADSAADATSWPAPVPGHTKLLPALFAPATLQPLGTAQPTTTLGASSGQVDLSKIGRSERGPNRTYGRRTAPILAAGACIAAVTGFVVWPSHRNTPPLVSPTPHASAEPPLLPTAGRPDPVPATLEGVKPGSATPEQALKRQPGSVTIALDTLPSGARVTDGEGKTIGETPLHITHELSQSALELKLERKGFRSQTVVLPLSVSSDRTVRLQKSKQAPEVANVPHPPVLKGPGKPNCSPNFYLDAQGDKHFKPECF